jgi:hypothetical protein
MIESVQGKPLRGILSGVTYSKVQNRCFGILESPDLCEGEVGRNRLEQGMSIHTSAVQGYDVVEGQLVIITTFSAYIVEGSITVLDHGE